MGGGDSGDEYLRYGSILGLVYFDRDWNGFFSKVSMDGIPKEKRRGYGKRYIMLRYAMKPICEELQIPWDEPPANPTMLEKASDTIKSMVSGK